MAHGARKLAHEAAALLAMDEYMMLYQRDARARVFISMIPVHDGINIMDSGDLYSILLQSLPRFRRRRWR